MLLKKVIQTDNAHQINGNTISVTAPGCDSAGIAKEPDDIAAAVELPDKSKRHGINVSCFGDSNTYGYDPRSWLGGRYGADSRWVDILAAKTGWTVQNLGVNGREIPQTAPGIPSGTDLLIVMLGSNDLLQGRGPEAAAGKLERFLFGLPLPRNQILLIAPPPMQPGTWVPSQQLIDDSRAFAQRCRILAEGLGIRFADAGNWDIPMTYDGVHFTAQGHRAFAAGLLEVLR